jgi:hypothetical protein
MNMPHNLTLAQTHRLFWRLTDTLDHAIGFAYRNRLQAVRYRLFDALG